MNIKKGQKGEEYAAHYLCSEGYDLLKRNFYTRYGEIDIITRKDRIITFVEVKTRVGDYFGNPEEAVNYTKALRIYKSIMEYFKLHKSANWQIDVIAIQVNSFDEVKDLRHYMNVSLF